MGLERVTTTDESAISLESVKAYCGLSGTSDFDDKIGTALQAAIEYVEHRSGYITAPDEFLFTIAEAEYFGWQWRRGGANLDLPIAPIRAILAVKYFDEAGDPQTVSEDDYVFERAGMRGGSIRFKSDFSFPSFDAERSEPLSVEIMAGFDVEGSSGAGDDPALLLPKSLRAAIFMLSERFYNAGALKPEEIRDLEAAADMLIDKIRVIRF